MKNKKLIKIYVENGSLTKEIKQLNKLENVKLIYFPFENKIKKFDFSNMPSDLTWDNDFITFDTTKITFGGCDKSEKYDELIKIIGKNNITDVKHVDTAYKDGCEIFITNDKDDISNKREEIYKTIGVQVFYHLEIEEIKEYIINYHN